MRLDVSKFHTKYLTPKIGNQRHSCLSLHIDQQCERVAFLYNTRISALLLLVEFDFAMRVDLRSHCVWRWKSNFQVCYSSGIFISGAIIQASLTRKQCCVNFIHSGVLLMAHRRYLLMYNAKYLIKHRWMQNLVQNMLVDINLYLLCVHS
jgi:hypothetical protein